MTKAHMMNDAERERRLAAFDMGPLLSAVDDVDLMCGHGYMPPEIRDELLRLHGLSMRVVRHGSTSSGRA